MRWGSLRSNFSFWRQRPLSSVLYLSLATKLNRKTLFDTTPLVLNPNCCDFTDSRPTNLPFFFCISVVFSFGIFAAFILLRPSQRLPIRLLQVNGSKDKQGSFEGNQTVAKASVGGKKKKIEVNFYKLVNKTNSLSAVIAVVLSAVDNIFAPFSSLHH